MRPASLAAPFALAAAAAAGAAAPSAAESYDATHLKLERFVGGVTIETGGVDRITAAYDPGEGLIDAPDFDVRGDTLEIVQLGRRDDVDCRGGRGELRVQVERGRFRPIESYGRLTIRVPEGARVQIEGGAVSGTIGDVAALDLGLTGCGDMQAGDVAGDARVSIYGSGDVELGEVGGRLEASIYGSGSVKSGVAHGLEASIYGSGGVDVAGVEGDMDAAIRGSGDIDVASVRGKTEASIFGSGDVEVTSVEGDVEASIFGSGSVEVRGGHAGTFAGGIHGSGDITFDGTADRIRIDNPGSGEINLSNVSGPVVMSSGGGKVRIGREE